MGNERFAPFDPTRCVNGVYVERNNNEKKKKKIHTSLIPSLDSGSNGVEDDSIVQTPGELPAMRDLFTQANTVVFIEFRQSLEVPGVLGDESTFFE